MPIETSILRTGKLPARYDKRDLHFSTFMTRPRPKRPAVFGHQHIDVPWGVLGNDAYGCCVWAGGDHETMILQREGGALNPASFDAACALADYAALTGFNPVTGENDSGTVVRDALDYRRQVGLIDTDGRRHKIGAYMALEPGNLEHLLDAAFFLGVVGIGIEFPESAMDQFNAHKPWKVVAGAAPQSGHYIPVVGFDGEYLLVVTWGRVQRVSKRFYLKYCDESWGYVSPEIFSARGKTPEGLDEIALQAALRDLAA